MKFFAQTLAWLPLALTVHAATPNLVPETPATSPNYWCTWYAQNYWIDRGTDRKNVSGLTNQAAREELNEHAIFNKKDGWATNYLQRGRQDYIFLIDHGWQTKDPAKRIAGGAAFFNLVAEEKDFPSYAKLEPAEFLKRFNEDIRSLGWNSLGIWTRGDVSLEQARTFVAWSKAANIRYWKIDGGDTQDFNSFKAKQELYPELVLEYVTGAGGNLNPKWNRDLPAYPSVYDFGGPLRTKMLNCLRYSDTFRTYDATPLLMSTTTLRRTHDILKQTQQQSGYRAILNVQDDCNIAIGLGVLVSSKRHPNMGERTYKGRDLHHQLSGPRAMQKRINETERFGRWARLAPAFPAGQGTYLSSKEELVDRCRFTEWDTWNKATYGKMVSQSAPAIIARNMPLPEVTCEGPPPYVCATTYPNGPTGIATEGRVSPEKKWFEPRANVTVQIKDASQPIGVAGHYKSLTLQFAGSIENIRHLWAQDLLANQAIDILPQVKVSENTLTIPGELIDKIGTSAGDADDLSAPGMVLRLEGNDLPAAGDEFTPTVAPATAVKRSTKTETKQIDGYSGTALVKKHPYGYLVSASGPAQVVLKKLDEGITSGTFSVKWKMKSDKDAVKQNGMLVLSSDADGTAALCAGAWMGADKITLFENSGKWGDDLTAACDTEGELTCHLTVDLDRRTGRLTINGKSLDLTFSETVTSINYIGFGTHHAQTLFEQPALTRP